MNHHQRRMRGVVAIAAAGLLLVAGCSSPAQTDTAPAPAASAEAGSTAASEVAAAKSAIEPLLKPPTSINQEGAVSGDTSSTKPYVVITCELPQCATIANGALDAAKTMGWTTKELSTRPPTARR